MYEIWLRAIKEFTVWLESGGARPGTIRLRRCYLQRLAAESTYARDTDLFDEHDGAAYDPGVGPWDVTSARLSTFIAQYKKSAETMKSVRASVCLFYRWATEEEYLEKNPARNLPRIRIEKRPPHPTPDAVYQPALARADARERIMIKLGGKYGLRRQEIADCDGDWLDEYDVLWVLGKGGRTRRIPIEDLEVITAFRRAGRGPVFPGGTATGHIGANWVGKLLSRTLADPEYSGHSLRHRFGTRALRGSHDIRAVQELLGHASVETTMIYTLVEVEDLKAAVEAAA